EQPGEEHHLRADEQDHPEDRVADPAPRVVGQAADRAVLGRRVARIPGRDDPDVRGHQWETVRPLRRSKSGRSERISGRWSKLYGGGGELVAHSRVFASHGSSPATFPLRSETKTFQRKGSMLAPISRLRNVAARLRRFQLLFA